MNTARAFGPAAVTGFPHGTHWVVRLFPRCQVLALLILSSVVGWTLPRLLLGCSILLDSETVRALPTYEYDMPDEHLSYRYWRLNPGQDTIDFRASPPDPVDNVKNTVARRSGSRSSKGSTCRSTVLGRTGTTARNADDDMTGPEKRLRESDGHPV